MVVTPQIELTSDVLSDSVSTAGQRVDPETQKKMLEEMTKNLTLALLEQVNKAQGEAGGLGGKEGLGGEGGGGVFI